MQPQAPRKAGRLDAALRGESVRKEHSDLARPHLLMMASTSTWMGFWSVSRWMISKACLMMPTWEQGEGGQGLRVAKVRAWRHGCKHGGRQPALPRP